jgi:hypothetical protein
MLRSLVFSLVVVMPVAALGQDGDKNSVADIKGLLLGNSIMHPTFGCSYYETGGLATQYDKQGKVTLFRWHVANGLYYSTGRCGVSGCSVSKSNGIVDFRGNDGTYRQQALLLKGNQCDRNRKVS